MPVTSRPPRPQSAHARTVKNDTYSSLAFTTVGEGSLTDSMEFTGSLTSAGDRTRPKSETPKLQRSRFPVDFSMSIDVSKYEGLPAWSGLASTLAFSLTSPF